MVDCFSDGVLILLGKGTSILQVLGKERKGREDTVRHYPDARGETNEPKGVEVLPIAAQRAEDYAKRQKEAAGR
jgi:hypothetical protein